MKNLIKLTFAAASALAITGCSAGGLGDLGLSGDTSSSASGQASTNSNITRCSQTLGTIAVDEDPDAQWRSTYSNSTGLQSVEPIIRQMVQESNCFVIVAGADTKQQKSIDRMMQYGRDSGEVRAGSNVQTGQAINADYVLFPEILYAGQESGGTDAGALTGLLKDRVPMVGLGGVSTKTKSTQVNMSVWSVRSRAQLASSTATKSARDFSFGGLAIGGLGAGAFKTASKTPEGKATVSAFVDAYNSMVVSLQNYEAQSVEGGAGTGGLIQDVQ